MAEPGLRAFALVGPTASGKTEVAHRLAIELRTAVVSADAMAVYRRLDIGTAKPGPDLRREVPYVGLDLADPGHAFSVHDFLAGVRKQLDSLAPAPAGATPPLVLAGGTGLYVSRLLGGLDPSPPPDPALRRRLEAVVADGGVAALQAEAERLAPGVLDRLADPRNPRRIIRAVEARGRPERAGRAEDERRPFAVGLLPDRTWLARRIRERVDRMFDCGLLEEMRTLRREGISLSPTAARAIGYAEAAAVLEGRMDLAAARERAALRTRQLARRQMTWFRHQLDTAWVEVEPDDGPEAVAGRVRERWEGHGSVRLAL